MGHEISTVWYTTAYLLGYILAMTKYGLISPSGSTAAQAYEVHNTHPTRIAFLQPNAELGTWMDLPEPDLPNKEWVWSEIEDGPLFDSLEDLLNYYKESSQYDPEY